MRFRLAVLTVAAAGFVAVAQAQPVPDKSADKGKETMGLPATDTAGANNGVGTAGSINGQNGSATSTVTGAAGGGTPFKGGEAGKGASGPMESDPAQGGGQQRQ